MFSPYSTLLSLNVFSAAELRKRIFGHLDKRRLADCARVCVIWSDDALDLIWKELGSVRPLLSILCPLTKNVGDEWCFARTLKSYDWARFHIYADRIKSLTIYEDENLSRDLINEVYRKKTVACLTPKLMELVVYRYDLAVFSEVFMHDGLRDIVVMLPRGKAEFEELMDNLDRKTKGLESASFYELDRSLELDILDEELGHFFRHHRSLQAIWLPFLTTSIVKALPHLESLIEINRTHWRSRPSIGADHKVDSSMPSLRLTRLFALSSFRDVVHLLGHLPNLEALGIMARWVETSSSLESLIAATSQACLSLEELEIEGIPDNWRYSTATARQNSACIVTVRALSTLEILRGLKRLHIVWPYPLHITEDDLSQLLPRLPDLSSLHLNCSPIILEETERALPLSIVSRIVEWCPKIRDLGLFLDCTDVELQDIGTTHSLLNLAGLNLGLSFIGETSDQLARYLSYFCSLDCTFDEGKSQWSSNEIIEAKVIQEYGADYARERWDGEREIILRMFRVIKELRSQMAELAEERDAALKKMDDALRLIQSNG